MQKSIPWTTIQNDPTLADRLQHENTLWASGVKCIAGIDEVGRGPLAGPVVAAAVIFSPTTPAPPRGLRIDDSKALSAGQREEAFAWIRAQARAFAIARVDPEVIDDINIRQAAFLAMHLALEQLPIQPDYLLVDGFELPDVSIPQMALVKGDRHSLSIAAASILAKVERDRLMQEYHHRFPQYQFNRNKGYPTRAHIEAIRQWGFCPIHRRSFRPKQLIEEGFFDDEPT
ncbi:MAG: ribonuclease HII [candidate division KSB1 bacterium]|nr:ribonuclease HII [candidate division KSB1 bacterium]